MYPRLLITRETVVAVTPARAAQWSITMNYLENKQCAVIRKADKDKYNSYDALKKARIVAEDGSAGEGNADDSHCFMNYLNGGKILNGEIYLFTDL